MADTKFSTAKSTRPGDYVFDGTEAFGCSANGSGTGAPLETGMSLAEIQGASSNVIYVGDLAEFQTIQSALDSITDSSVTNQYIINVMPGTYGPFDFDTKQGITVSGSGWTTIVECIGSLNNAGMINLDGLENTVQNMKIVYVDDGNPTYNQYMIIATAPGARLQVLNCYIDIEIQETRTAEVWAIGSAVNRTGPNTSEEDGWGIVVRDCIIVTDSCGFSGAWLTNDLFNNIIYMTTRGPGATHAPMRHIGVDMSQDGRTYWYSGRVTTGYRFPNISDLNADVYGFYYSSTAAGSRLNIYQVEGVLLNETTGTGSTYFVYAPSTMHANAQIRLYVFRGQVETSNAESVGIKADYSYNSTGKVLLKMDTDADSLDNIFGFNIRGDTNWNGWSCVNREVGYGGNWSFDTTAGAINIDFPAVGERRMVTLRVYNTGTNTLTLTGTSAATFDTEGGAQGAATLVIPANTSVVITTIKTNVYNVKT